MERLVDLFCDPFRLVLVGGPISSTVACTAAVTASFSARDWSLPRNSVVSS
jgi:hypothetical protein